jgi:hypothetical protein
MTDTTLINELTPDTLARPTPCFTFNITFYASLNKMNINFKYNIKRETEKKMYIELNKLFGN